MAEGMVYIMSGYNQRAVIAFLRYLSKIRYSDYAIIASREDDPIFMTGYREHVIYTRKCKELTLDEFDDIFDQNSKTGIFMPSTEALVRFQVENKSFFKDHNVLIPVVDKELYETISDKHKFWELCNKEGFLVPQIYEETGSISYPVMIKPKTYRLSTNEIISPVMAASQEELKSFLDGRSADEFDFQQYVTGESYYLLYYISKEGHIYSFSQKNYLQQPNGKSMMAARPSHLHEQEISGRYGNLLRSVGFYGLIMIELRKHNDQYYMIEANPRMWGPSQLYVDAGVDFMGFLLRDNGIDIRLEEKTPDYSVRYFWSGGGSGNLQKYSISDYGEFEKEIEIYKKYDIYNRPDTEKIYSYERNAR